MAVRKKARGLRALLIYCEGKTEAYYFEILLDFYRPPAYVDVEIRGQKGQHIALVDSIVIARADVCEKMGLDEDEVECWAVCDEDKMPCTFSELSKYADDHNVRLAFSAPQFEMYLLQHFEQSGDSNKTEVFKKLSVYRKFYGCDGDYGEDTKADLSWMSKAIDSQPKIVKTAVINSAIRDRATKKPFLTVQKLTNRILELSL